MKVGVFEGKIIGVCPDKEELESLLGKKFNTEPEYVTNRGCDIVFVVKDVASDYIGFVTFPLEDKKLYYRTSQKLAYKNRLGWTRAFEEDKVSSSFYLGGEVEPCIKGETELLSLLREWLPANAEIGYNLRRILDANFSDLKNLIKQGEGTVLFAATVKIDVNGKTTNPIYHRAFSKGSDIEHFKTVYGAPYIKTLINKPELESYQRFILNVGNPKYPCPNYYHLGPMKVYIHEENEIRSNKSILK